MLITLEETIAKINEGKILHIAADHCWTNCPKESG